MLKTGLNTVFAVSLILGLVALAGCGVTDPAGNGAANLRDEICIDGVTYIIFKGQAGYAGWGYMSVKFNKDSKVVSCN